MPLDEQLARSRDRITELLTKKRPDMGDVSTSMLRAVTGRTSYGEELNRMKAGRLAEQKTVFDVLSGHKKLQQEDRALGITQKKNAWDKIKWGVEQNNKNAIATHKMIGDLTTNEGEYRSLATAIDGRTDLNRTDMPGVQRALMEEAGKLNLRQEAPKKTELVTLQSPDDPNTTKSFDTLDEKAAIRSHTDKGWTKTTRGVSATSVGGLTASQAGKEKIDLKEQRVNLINLTKAGLRLRDDLKESGSEVIGFTGGLERYFDTFISQGKALARRYGDRTRFSEWTEQIEWSGELAGQSAAVKSQIASMAYSIALAKNGTRPTDEDVLYALQMIGNSGSVNQMSSAIDSLLREGFDSYSTRHLETTGKSWDAQAALKEHGIPVPGGERTAQLEYIRQTESGDEKITPEVIRVMDEDEIDDLLSDDSLPDWAATYIQDRMQELGI